MNINNKLFELWIFPRNRTSATCHAYIQLQRGSARLVRLQDSHFKKYKMLKNILLYFYIRINICQGLKNVPLCTDQTNFRESCKFSTSNWISPLKQLFYDIINEFKFKDFEIFLWKKRRFRLCLDSSPDFLIAGRLLSAQSKTSLLPQKDFKFFKFKFNLHYCDTRV